MIKCRRRQDTDPQKLKNAQRLVSRFLLVEAEAVEVEAIGVKAEAVYEITASLSLGVTFYLSQKVVNSVKTSNFNAKTL